MCHCRQKWVVRDEKTPDTWRSNPIFSFIATVSRAKGTNIDFVIVKACLIDILVSKELCLVVLSYIRKCGFKHHCTKRSTRWTKSNSRYYLTFGDLQRAFTWGGFQHTNLSSRSWMNRLLARIECRRRALYSAKGFCPCWSCRQHT